MTFATTSAPMTPQQLQTTRIYTSMTLQSATAQALTGVSPRGKQVSVLVAPDANVWKGAYHQGLGVLVPGDDLYIRLVRNDTNDLRANLIIANHVNLYGYVTQYSNGAFQISVAERRSLNRTSVRTTASLHTTTLLSVPADSQSFKTGTLVQIIGVREPNGNIRATHIMVLG